MVLVKSFLKELNAFESILLPVQLYLLKSQLVFIRFQLALNRILIKLQLNLTGMN